MPRRNDRQIVTGNPFERTIKLLSARIDGVRDELRTMKAAHRSPTVPRYDPHFPLDGVEGQIALHTGEHIPPPTEKKPWYYADGDWHPFVEFPNGIIGGVTSVDLAYRIPGSLVWLYRLGEAFTPAGTIADAALDTSLFGITPRNLTYHENTAAPDWDVANRPDTHVIDHPALGSGDDGSVKFNYNGWFSSSDAGGAWLESSIGGNSDFGAGLKTVSAWFKADPAGHTFDGTFFGPVGLILGTYDAGPHGWGIFYEFGDDHLVVIIGPSVVLSLPGLIRGRWYHVALSYETATDTFRLYLNAVELASWVAAGNTGTGSALKIGGGVTPTIGVGFRDFFVGEIDDCAGWSTTLTRDEIASVFLGKGAGTQTTLEQVTVTAGDPATNPGAISSVVDGANSDANLALVADGNGGTTFGYPDVKVYLRGA